MLAPATAGRCLVVPATGTARLHAGLRRLPRVGATQRPWTRRPALTRTIVVVTFAASESVRRSLRAEPRSADAGVRETALKTGAVVSTGGGGGGGGVGDDPLRSIVSQSW